MTLEKQFRIFIIDDSDEDIQLISQILVESQITTDILYTKNSEIAIDFLKNQIHSDNNLMPSLIILDFNMPKNNGFEVLKSIKSEKELINIPIIIFSTSIDFEDKELIIQQNVFSILAKPFIIDDYDTLINTIKSLKNSN